MKKAVFPIQQFVFFCFYRPVAKRATHPSAGGGQVSQTIGRSLHNKKRT